MKKRICMCVLLCLMFVATIVAPVAASAIEIGSIGAIGVGAPTMPKNEPTEIEDEDTPADDKAQPDTTNASEEVNTNDEVEDELEETEEETEEVEEVEEEDLSGIKVYVDGTRVKMNGAAPVIIDGTTFVPVRAVCEALGAEVIWLGTYVECYAPNLALSMTPGKSYIWANERYLPAEPTVRLIGNTLMVPVRLLAKAFDAQVTWDGTASSILLTKSARGGIISGSEFYNATDLYWLSRIIWAEAGNQSMAGKVAVGNVIMNRVKSPLFPNSIYNVIFSGIQFSPVQNGTIYNTPTNDCVLAAKLAMEGMRTVGDSLFFASIRNCWANYSRPFYTKLGDHYFWL